MTSTQTLLSTPTAFSNVIALPIKNDKVGAPRLDPYQRLLHRIYEPMFLLKAIGQTRGNHTPESRGSTELEISRRSFMQALTYFCDFKKGGPSCAALAIEEAEYLYTFWVACNDQTYAERMAAFLRNVLESVHHIVQRREHQERDREKEDKLFRTCLEFAAPRVRSEALNIRKAIEKCKECLGQEDSDFSYGFSAWLDSMIPEADDNTDLCRAAWAATKSSFMASLVAAAKREKRKMGPNDIPGPFSVALHCIGRLAWRFHMHRLLLRCSTSVSYLLSEFAVRVVPPVQPVSGPLQDSHTTLHGILNRMLRAKDPERQRIENGLIAMDVTAGIFRKFSSNLQRCNPVVHAEVQVLEHFFAGQRKFTNNDRFIAISKPACLCCKLYFQHHPARMVVPQSHEKIWPNWSPPRLTAFKKDDKESNRQRDVLNKIITALRDEIIAQVLKCSQPAAWHPDSQTGITALDDTASTSFNISSSESESGKVSSVSSYPPSKCDVANEDKDKSDDDNDDDNDDNGGVSLK